MIETNWYIITGAPCAGKTKVIEHLASLGYVIVPEASRILIDTGITQGKTTKDVRADEAEFQKKVLKMKVLSEDNLLPEQIAFIDGGAIPSSIAYYQVSGLDPAPVINESQKRKYKGIFFLERLQLERDYARMEDEETVNKLNKLLYDSYTQLGYDVVRVPVKPINERVEFILSKIK